MTLHLAGDRDTLVYHVPATYTGASQDERGIARGEGPYIAVQGPAGNVLSVLQER